MPKTRVSPASRINPAPKPIQNKDLTKKEAVQMAANLLYAAGVDTETKALNKQTKGELVNFLNMASMISRRDMSTMLGKSFGGKRDLYEVLGWKRQLEFRDYLNMYERNGIAARVVDIKADESWRKFPIIHDGKSQDDYMDDTPFLKAWNDMVEELDLASVFNELDVALGISRYSAILLGVEGDTSYTEPLKPGGSRKIKFLRVLDEGQLTMSMPDADIFSERYGLPDQYSCQFEEEGRAVPVHWTRIVHFKQGRGRSNIYGIPGLQRSFNFLQDLEKVTGSASEAFWQHIRRIFILAAKEGFQLPSEGTPEFDKLMEQVDEIEHQMRQVWRVRNMDVNQLSHAVVDGRNTHDVLIADISGTEGIPQRLLVGSERGELASSQDERNWAKTINARQTKSCEKWLKNFIRHLIDFGFLPAPKSGKFSVEWESLYEMTEIEKVELGTKKIGFLKEATDGNIMDEYEAVKGIMAETLDGYVPDEDRDDVQDEESEADEESPEDDRIGAGLEEQPESILEVVQ